MRMRRKPNLIPRMEKCADILINKPEENKGAWRTLFPQYDKIYLELGCGKGRFTAEMAETIGDTLLLALEKVPDAMIIGMERVKAREIKNVRFIDGDVVNIPLMFEKGEVDRIFINFCDPWPKSRDAKFRLTAPSFLRLYSSALPLGGQIHFKTDNTPLFNWSMEEMKKEGWELGEITNDLHADGTVGIMTDYEAKFTAQGMKINRLVATKVAGTLDTSAGAPPRMYDNALTDAKGYEESKARIKANMEAKEK